MRIKLDDVEAFCAVVDYGSFKEAANELNITPSALSRRLSKLEDLLGARLLDRTTRQVSASTIGEEFLPEAQRIVATFRKSVDNLHDLIHVRTGSVSLATNMTIADTILPRIIRKFREENPFVKVFATESSSPQALDRVLNHECEFAIAQFGEGLPGLEFEPLLEDYFVLLCHQDHPLATQNQITWADLEKYNFIQLRGSSGTIKILKRTLGDQMQYLSGDFKVGHFSTLLGFVGENLGISAIPSIVNLRRPDINLVTRPIGQPSVSRQLGIVTKRGRSLSPAGNVLADVCRTMINQFT